jgi:aminoglycoside/choline kinase family phosphotransferase
MKKHLEKIFKDWSGETVESITPLPRSGSSRHYFRMKSINHQALGVINSDINENKAFIYFTNHFKKYNLNVPQIYKSDIDKNIYLVEDFGDETLFNYLNINRPGKEFPEEAIAHYKNALIHLIDFQIKTAEGMDYSVCCPRECFDRQSMMWDLNYFKYYFLKITNTPFDEQKLENDFNTLTNFLLAAPADYFLYRDFQSRNIMIKDNKLFFIDYQGGRKGALQYDVASLLYDAKADIPPAVRNQLFNFYVEKLQQKIHIDKDEFTKYYYGYVLIRILQSMGAYGFRGIHEKKAHFLKSIPYAVRNINYLISEKFFPAGMDELKSVLRNVIKNDKFKKIESIIPEEKLTVSINSFSYKSGIPADLSGNDGGFVFDCRSLHNPGRYDEFKMLTGRDEKVITFLNKQNDVQEFLEDVKSISERAINNYIQRGFSNLMINFGCTGGQHRSVYCAEILSEVIKLNFDIIVSLNHTELEKKDML